MLWISNDRDVDGAVDDCNKCRTPSKYRNLITINSYKFMNPIKIFPELRKLYFKHPMAQSRPKADSKQQTLNILMMPQFIAVSLEFQFLFVYEHHIF